MGASSKLGLFSGLATIVTLLGFVTGVFSLPQLIGLVTSRGSPELAPPGSTGVNRRAEPPSVDIESPTTTAPELPTAGLPSARVACSVAYEQRRSEYMGPELWISQRVVPRIREYNGVRVVFDRYSVTLLTASGCTWVHREFELPKPIVVPAKSAAQGSFFLDETILKLWNRNAAEPDNVRVRIEEMRIRLMGEDENGHRVSIDCEGDD